MHFKDSPQSLPEIARALHVDALVEGSVIRDGSRIRVTAQLIRGSTDEHFWSETYDHELRDALTLESEIAQSIARRVEVTVTAKNMEGSLLRVPSPLKSMRAISKVSSRWTRATPELTSRKALVTTRMR